MRNYPFGPCQPHFGEEEPLLTINTNASLERMGTADFNMDGFTDVIVTRLMFQTLTTHEISILLNDQRGSLIDSTKNIFDGPIPAVQHPTSILIRDFNGDGRPDIFIADLGMDTDPFPGYQNSLILSTPSGKLRNATSNLPQFSDGTHSAAAADIDGDEDLDLYLGNLGNGAVPPIILLNDGQGSFSQAKGLLPPAQIDLALNWYTASQFVDVNNDDNPDLILGQGNPNRDSHVLLNDGSGRFSQMSTPLPPTIFAPIQQPIDIQAADIDDDGFQDLLLVDTRNTYWGRTIQLLINKGDGTFRDETDRRISQKTEDGWLRYIKLVDFNYDGHLDFAVSALEGPHSFYLNDGHGSFYPWDPGIDLFNFAFLDIDNDGWRDILNAGNAEPGVYPIEWHAIHRHSGCQNPDS